MSVETNSESALSNLAGLHGKKFDVMLVDTGNDKSELLTGTGRWHDGRFSIYRGAKLPELPVPVETLGGLVPVPRALRSLLEGADYMIKLHVRRHSGVAQKTLASS